MQQFEVAGSPYPVSFSKEIVGIALGMMPHRFVFH